MVKYQKSRLRKITDMVKTAYLGQDDRYEKIKIFLEGMGRSRQKEWLKSDQKRITLKRTCCYLLDLAIVGTTYLTGDPIFLCGFMPSSYLRLWLAAATKKNIYEHERSNEVILMSDFRKANQTQEPSGFSETVGLDSIDRLIQNEYREDNGYWDPDWDDEENKDSDEEDNQELI